MKLRGLLAIGVACIVAACAVKQEKREVQYPNAIDCRTVQLFDKNIQSPSNDVPEQWRKFSGHWGHGAWGGKLCHELVIEEVRADGTARVVEMQGDYAPWDRWPTAFRREAQFLPDGGLQVKFGRLGSAVYRIEGGVMYGVYDWNEERHGITLFPK